MSWDLYLQCDSCEHMTEIGNYTHNTNEIIRAASVAPKKLKHRPSVAGEVLLHEKTDGKCWGDFDGKSATAVMKFCNKIIVEIEHNQVKYLPLQPDNGWGSLEGVLAFIREIRDACEAHPNLTFRAHG